MKETIGIFGMTCMHCHKRVTDAISKVNGVKSVDVSLENKSATVEFDDSVTNLNAIKQAVNDAGYDVGEKTISKPEPEAQQSVQACPVVIEDDKKTVEKPATKQKIRCFHHNHTQDIRHDMRCMRPEYRKSDPEAEWGNIIHGQRVY